MIPKYLQVGRRVAIRTLSQWRPGTVVARTGLDVTIAVDGYQVSVHHSVIRRDLRQHSPERPYMTIKGRRRYFETLDAAAAVRDAIFDRTGIIVGIEVAR